MAAPVLVWFRDDYRLADNPALNAAIESGAPVLCCFVFDQRSDGVRALGGAARWWLHGSLRSLNDSLQRIGGALMVFDGDAHDGLDRIVSETGASGVFWNRRYTSAEIALDSRAKTSLKATGVAVQSFNGRLIHEPWEICNQSGKPFKVFTPYSRAAMARPIPAPLPAPQKIRGGVWPASLQKASIPLSGLKEPDWATGFAGIWNRGELAARERLARFLNLGLQGYAENRDRPGIDGSSRLSPHLRHGEISPRQVWHAVAAARAENPALDRDGTKFLTELIWRDFCWQLLYQFPDLPTASHLGSFNHMPWSAHASALTAWQQGMTGYPIVDAGMRQLWRTGWMHNRVRMIVASFLTKHLLVDWRRGETWFWDTLVDADVASNAFNWQWVAGSGPDSAPFHRIFNPVLQGETFDPEGTYVRAFVPELARLPSRYIHQPWRAPTDILAATGVVLGETYPAPIVDHAAARRRALDAFRQARQATA